MFKSNQAFRPNSQVIGTGEREKKKINNKFSDTRRQVKLLKGSVFVCDLIREAWKTLVLKVDKQRLLPSAFIKALFVHKDNILMLLAQVFYPNVKEHKILCYIEEQLQLQREEAMQI